MDKNTAYDPPISPSYQYIYDNDHRLVRTVFPSGAAIENVYENGQLRRVKTPEGDVVMDYLCSAKIGTVTMGTEFLNFEYDGPLVTSLEQAGELNALLTFGYDDTMRLESFGYAGGTTTFGYDLDGLLTTIGDFTIERDAANGLPLAVDDETARLEREFNGYGEVERQTLSVAGNVVGEVALTRDDVGRIIAKTETIGGVAYEFEYEYDDFGRLATVRDGAGSELERYTYGPQGERLTETNVLRGIVSRSFTYDDEDRLLTAGDVEYTFDDDGFLTSKTEGSETTTYDYSSRGELKKVELPDGKVVEYKHDPMGRRVAKLVDGVIQERYLWLGRTRLLAVYDANGSLKWRFKYADGRIPISGMLESTKYYFKYDQVGSLRAIVDEMGSVIKTIRYDSFGNVIEDSNPTLGVPFGFAGGLHDGDTRLVRFGFRDYDPDTGRWTVKDPIGFAGGDVTVYGYVKGNPVNSVDPRGLCGAGTASGSGLMPSPASHPVFQPGSSENGAFVDSVFDAFDWLGDHYNPDNYIAKAWNYLFDDEAEGGLEQYINEDGTVNDSAGVDNTCDESGKWKCEGYSQYDQVGTPKYVRRKSTMIIAYGQTETIARNAWIKKAQDAAPRGFTARHIRHKCTKVK